MRLILAPAVAIAFVGLLTAFLFPIKQPGAVASLSEGTIIARPTVVRLVLAPSLLGKKSPYFFDVAPAIGEFTHNVPLSAKLRIGVLADPEFGSVTGSESVAFDGTISSRWAFDWPHWLSLNFLPGLVLGSITLLIRCPKRTTKAM